MGAPPKGIGLTHAMVDEIYTHALACDPEESCGLLAGLVDSDVIRVERVICMTNAEPGDKSVRYLLDAGEQFRAMRSAEADGLEIIGTFHSHVQSPAIPSETDLALAAYPEWAWLIVSLGGSEPELKAYSIDGGSYREIPVRYI